MREHRNNGIPPPPDLIRYCKTTLLQPLHDTLCQCWSEGGVLQDMRDAMIVRDMIVTLYKNKGGRSDCNNFRGISLLSIMGKPCAVVLLLHLQQLAERIYPESQCGFEQNVLQCTSSPSFAN